MSWDEFTPEKPCRCGYAGEGAHLCHYARAVPGEQCQQEGISKLIPTLGSLAGLSPKLPCVVGCYCREHWEELLAGLAQRLEGAA